MGKIISFNMDELLDTMDQYCNMMFDVEQRCTELAKTFGNIGEHYLIQSVDFGHNAQHAIVIATFENLETKSTLNITFDSKWLFGDPEYFNRLDNIDILVSGS